MALLPGTIIVADPQAFGGTGGLIAVDPSNGQQTTLARGGMFVEPSHVAFTADGRLLVSDLEAFGTGGLIAVDPASGQQTKVVSSTVFRRPFGITVEADDQVVVAYLKSPGNGAVMRVNPANGEHREVAPGVNFILPSGVALDATGNIVVCEANEGDTVSRLFRVDKGVGASILAIGKPEGASYQGIAIESTGHILVTSRPADGESELLRFHPTSGAVMTVSKGNMIRAPFGVAVEANGAILVIDIASGVVRVNPAMGAQTTVSTGGSLVRPRGAAIQR